MANFHQNFIVLTQTYALGVGRSLVLHLGNKGHPNVLCAKLLANKGHPNNTWTGRLSAACREPKQAFSCLFALFGALYGSKVLIDHPNLSRVTIFLALTQSRPLALGTGPFCIPFGYLQRLSCWSHTSIGITYFTVF